MTTSTACPAPCLTAEDLGEGDDAATVLAPHPDCPVHGDPTSLGAHINRLALEQQCYERIAYWHDEHPESASALFSAELADEQRDQALDELVAALLRRRLHLRPDADARAVQEKLVGTLRDAESRQVASGFYLAGIRAVLDALGQPKQ